MLQFVQFYLGAGVLCALAFLILGVERALGAHPVHVSLGARILLFPGAVVLWPLVLVRWLRSGAAR